MIVSVKTKIWLGTIFLFLLLMLTGAVGIYYTSYLKNDSKSVLKNNYESLAYSHSIQQQLLLLKHNYSQSIHKIDSAITLQEKNVTEPGEGKATTLLREKYRLLKAGDTTYSNIQNMQSDLQNILQVNMDAIQVKNDKALATADKALAYIIALSGIIFLIGFTFIVNFPSIVTRPITQLTEAIKEIAEKNYTHRIHFSRKDEFGKLGNAFNEMAERLEYFESSNLNKLMFEKSRAEAVINSLKDASIGLDKNNTVLFANYQALQLLGLPLNEVLRKSASELKIRNDLFRFLMEHESTVPFKIVVDNRENYFVKETMEVAQEGSKSKVIVLKNITSFKELDVAKTNFIATISHELKTPLASSDFSIKLLNDERTGKLSKEQKELLNNIEQDNQRMLKILSELLNLSQVEAGHIQMNIKKVSPLQIIKSAIKNAEAAANEKHLSLLNEVEENLPDLEADADKTIWVLNNLLSNAIKYSFENNVVEVDAIQEKNTIIISVKDHGPGIDESYLTRIFERYFQVPGSKEKGTGLGLAISQEFIEAQNGKIWVESEIGKGSVFYIQLPIN